MSELSTAPMHRLLKKAGAERVSEEAAEELRRVLEEVGIMVSNEAIRRALAAGRKTVRREDVREAALSLIPNIRLD
ncbi:MAG: NFYB/HAP3 family transcription factor subunit [Nitrososphaerota archaeon]|nr:NFYB/HAP3 family transcription factor subunit [Candidatus Calditenuis fumarioli]